MVVRLCVACLAVASVLGLVLVWLRHDGDRVDRVVVAVLPVSLVAAILESARNWLLAPSLPWNDVRLASTVAMARGVPLYCTHDAGTVLSTMYTPGSALAYLPAARAVTPEGAILAAAAMAQAYYVVPAAILILGYARQQGAGRAVAMMGVAVLGLLTFFGSPGLRDAACSVHADAPALGLGLAAVAVLVLRAEGAGPPGWAATGASAALAWAAFWSKQTMAPLVLAIPAWAAVACGAGAAIRYLAATAAAGLVLGGGSLVWVGFDGFLFNAWLIPGRYPWKSTDAWGPYRWKAAYPDNLLLAAACLALECRGLLAAAGAGAAALARAGAAAGPRGARGFLARERWALPLVAAAALAPTSALGYVKEGGSENSFAPTLYFLLAAVLMMATRLWALSPTATPPSRGFARPTLAALAAAIGLSGAVESVVAWADSASREAATFHGPQAAYAFLLRHPGRVYFAANPLAHLLAEGRAYHFLGSVLERGVAGYPISKVQLRAHMPESPRLVIFPRPGGTGMYTGWVLQYYLSEYDRPVDVPALPQFEAFERSAEVAPPPDWMQVPSRSAGRATR